MGGTSVLVKPLGAILLDAASVEVELMTLDLEELKCITGFLSNHLPILVKNLTFDSSIRGAPIGIHKPNAYENGNIKYVSLQKEMMCKRESHDPVIVTHKV
jgi:hypothetical protein